MPETKSTNDRLNSDAAGICVVVVTYQPEANLLDNVQRLASQAAEVVIVDNGSRDAAAQLVEAAAKLPRVRVFRNGANLGIAAALNVGIRYALKAGYPWVATFDQDSAIPERYFEALLQVYRSYPRPQEVGMLVPLSWSAETAGTTTSAKADEPEYSFVTSAINSGSLVRAEAFSAAGLYDEPLFIDYVDLDFCFKLVRAGYKILAAKRAVLCHELGTPHPVRLFGKQIATFRVHTAWRYYYIMRNRLVLYRRHGAKLPRWMLSDGIWMVLELGRIVCVENGRVKKVGCALRGLLDGLRGKQGRHPKWPPPIAQPC